MTSDFSVGRLLTVVSFDGVLWVARQRGGGGRIAHEKELPDFLVIRLAYIRAYYDYYQHRRGYWVKQPTKRKGNREKKKILVVGRGIHKYLSKKKKTVCLLFSGGGDGRGPRRQSRQSRPKKTTEKKK